MRPLACLILMMSLWLSACGRPMAPGERALASDIFGPALNTDVIRVKSGFRGAPTTKDAPLPPKIEKIELRPGVCDRVSPTPPDGPPPAWALYNNIHFAKDYYRSDLAPGWPEQTLIPQTLIFAHELVHVWQWQHRKRTGYRPIKAGLESVLTGDPYFYVPGEGGDYLQYGFEQQASLLEDYFCYGLFDPENPRRAKIRHTLAPYFQMDQIDEALKR